MSSISINMPGKDEAIPEIYPMASIDRLETICPADWTNWASSSMKADRSAPSTRKTDCSKLSKRLIKAGST